MLELCLVFPLLNPPPGADQNWKRFVDPPLGGGEKWTGPLGGSQLRLLLTQEEDFLLAQEEDLLLAHEEDFLFKTFIRH